jgi:hypothetical protein
MHPSKTPPQERPWRATSLVHISRWRLDCPPAQVWDLLSCTEQWPQWWRRLERVDILRGADAASAGRSETMLHWRSPLGYSCRVLSLTTRREQDANGRGEIESFAQGVFRGRGLWLIEPTSPFQVDITYRWEVSLHKSWMRLLAPVLRGVLSWNHFKVMQSGARGMAERLGCYTPAVSRWSGGPR